MNCVPQVVREQEALARIEAEHKATLAEKLAAKDELIADREREILRIQDMKAQLSTKMLGESLEQHCEIEFNRRAPPPSHMPISRRTTK